MRFRQRWLAGLVCFLGLSLIGCGQSETKLLTVPMTGTVTFKGNPVEAATLTFHPKTSGQTCQALTNAQGAFTVTTSLPGGEEVAGAVPGEYEVTITKLVVPEGSTEMVPPKNELPQKYAAVRTSKLTASAKADDANQADFKLD